MGEKNEFLEKLIKYYKVDESRKGLFYLQVDWILENAVYPLENGYAENVMDLWNIYMPEYKFDGIIIDYSKKYFPALRFVHDGEIYRFNSIKLMRESAIKNFIKYRISQGQNNRIVLIKECYDLMEAISEKSKLYDLINSIIELYFDDGEIGKEGEVFLNRFQDSYDQPYVSILERLTDIDEQKHKCEKARAELVNSLNVEKSRKGELYTLLNVVLCEIALSDGESRFSDVLKKIYSKVMVGIPYTDKVYDFIEKYEKPYMNAACFGIKNIRSESIIKALYKDSLILSACIEAPDDEKEFSMKQINDYWRKDGMLFSGGFYFDDEFSRMKEGLNKKVLIKYKEEINSFHQLLIDRINRKEFESEGIIRNHRNHDTTIEIGTAEMSKKDRQIDQLVEQIGELEDKIENAEFDALSRFLSLLDSKKYGYILGRLYRIAYAGETAEKDDIQAVLKNLFEVMSISGIDIVGEVGIPVSIEEIRQGKYRVDSEVFNQTTVKFPGYKIGDSVVLRPLAGEE